MKSGFCTQPAVIALSAISSLGGDWPSIWRALLSGERHSSSFADLGLPLRINVPVSEVSGLNRTVDLEKYGAACRLARTALDQILPECPMSVRLYGASNHAETDILLYLMERVPEKSPLWRALLLDPMPDYVVGRGTWVYSACTSGMHALLAAVLDGADGQAPESVVVAADALSVIGVTGFACARATTRTACAPFCEERDGLLVGEGAAALRLQVSHHPSGTICLLGYGMSCDAGHPTDPEATGAWLEQAIRDSLNRANLEPRQVAAIVAHGTGTTKNDAVEALVYQRLWPNSGIPVTSIKGALGHTMGAAGLFNVLVAVESTRNGLVPPTVLSTGSAMSGIDLIRESPRSIEAGAPVLAVASGFGGNNFACILGALR